MAPSGSSSAVPTGPGISLSRSHSSAGLVFTIPGTPIQGNSGPPRPHAATFALFSFTSTQKTSTSALHVSTRLGIPLHFDGTTGQVTTTPTPTQLPISTFTAMKDPSPSPGTPAAGEHIKGSTGGIVAGVLIAVLMIIVGFWFYWHRRRRLEKSITNGPTEPEPRSITSRLTSFDNIIPFRIFHRKKRSSSAAPHQLVDVDPETGVVGAARSFKVERSLRRQELQNPFRDPDPAEDRPRPRSAPGSARSNTDVNVGTANPLEQIQHLAEQLGAGTRVLRDGHAGPNVLSQADRVRLYEIRLLAERMVLPRTGGDNGNSKGHGGGGTSHEGDVGVGVSVNAGEDSTEDFLLRGQSLDWRDLLPPPPYRE